METTTFTMTPIRETNTDAGRVYQYSERGRANIDWAPPEPLAGFARLTRGMFVDDPAQGRMVRFIEKKGRKTICVRVTPERETLAELVRIAEAFEAESRARIEAEEARLAADRAGRRAADIAAFEATLPVGYVAIEGVDHNPGAGDGWGLTTFRHAGVDLASHEVAELGPKYHRPLGDSYGLRVYAPADALAALVGRKQAEATAKGETRAAKRTADDEARAAKIAEARETGKPIELARWTEPCDGSTCECSLDVVTLHAQPDGSIATRRTHTH